MSLETLLEAAMFLEWQAQQQNRACDDNEKLLIEREDEDDREKKVIVKIEIPDIGPNLPIDLPHPSPALPPPPSLVPPVTVIPLPVVASMPVQTVHPSLSTPLVHCHAPVVSSSNTCKEVSIASVNHRSCGTAHSELKKNVSVGSPELIHQYPTPVLAISQPHVVQSLQPQPQQNLQQQPVPQSPQGAFRLAAAEDMKTNEQKRRPGGRAHLKECFETLKRNIPNVDDKKTSNLSVLRSALRYIQTLKRKEKEYEHEMERLAREKIATQQRLEELKNELSQWMDVLEIERIIRQTVQPEDDQASTSTASEGEDNIDDDMDGDRTINLLPKLAHRQQSELLRAVPLGIPSTPPAVLPGHLSIHQKRMLSNPTPHVAAQTLVSPQSITPTQTHLVAASTVQSTVIAHTATTHASVIQTLNHILPRQQAKHITHIAPSTASPVPLSAAATQPISHITVHPARINHMGQQLPTIYPQPVAVSQPMVSHMAHGISHTQVNGTSNLSQQTVIAKPAVGTQVVHQQLVGQTVLNPVTMVTMPSFPVSTLKLA